MTITKYSKKDIGCYLDGARGYSNQGKIIQEFAKQNGWKEELELDYNKEEFNYAVDEAIKYLNKNHVKEGVYFGFNEGDFGLYLTEE